MDPPAVRARGDHEDGDSMIRGIISLGYSSLAMTIGLLLGGCNAVGPSTFEFGDLRAVVVVAPDVVPTNGSFEVQVDLINRGNRSIELRTGSCRAFEVTVTKGSKQLAGAFVPPTVFCTGIGGVYTIPPGGRVSPKMPLVANVTSGTFNLRVDFNFIEALPSLGAKLRVE